MNIGFGKQPFLYGVLDLVLVGLFTFTMGIVAGTLIGLAIF